MSVGNRQQSSSKRRVSTPPASAPRSGRTLPRSRSSSVLTTSSMSSSETKPAWSVWPRGKQQLRLTSARYDLFCPPPDLALGHDLLPQDIAGRHEGNVVLFHQSAQSAHANHFYGRRTDLELRVPCERVQHRALPSRVDQAYLSTTWLAKHEQTQTILLRAVLSLGALQLRSHRVHCVAHNAASPRRRGDSSCVGRESPGAALSCQAPAELDTSARDKNGPPSCL